MARYLAIDWNPPQLHVLAVDTAKGHARAVQALAVPMEEDLTPASAERIGKKLRDALKAANIAPAPALWTISRDRIILKELTIPPTPVNEEPAIVRFQVAKESTEPMADAAIDYTYAAPPHPNQPRKVLAVVGRKSVVNAIGAVCTAASLKLKAVTPRAFAASGLLARKGSPTEMQALLLPTGGGAAEFLVFRGTDLAWARTFPASSNLTAEVRRTLLLLTGQNPDMTTVARVLTPSSLKLGQLQVPVEPLDPWLPTDTMPEPAEAYLAPLGLAEASRRTLPINLAATKEPTATVDHGKQRRKAGMIAAAVLVPLLFVFGLVMLSQQRSRIKELGDAKEQLDSRWKASEQARVDVDGLKDWEQTSISWIDELYDIAARFPHETGLRLSQVSAAPLARKTNANSKDRDKFVGIVTLHGVMPPDQERLVSNFMRELRKDPHLRVTTPEYHGNEFTVKIEVAAQPGSAYKTHLEVPPQPKRSSEPEEMPAPSAGAETGAAEGQGFDPEDEP